MTAEKIEDSRIEALKALYPNWNPAAERLIRRGLRLLWDLRMDDLNESEARWVAALNALPAGEAIGEPPAPSSGTFHQSFVLTELLAFLKEQGDPLATVFKVDNDVYDLEGQWDLNHLARRLVMAIQDRMSACL